MLAVIFEVKPTVEGKAEYLALAEGLRIFLEVQDGLISIERFESLIEEGKLLSLSFWESGESIQAWRNLVIHRLAQMQGKDKLFSEYRICVAEVLRDYTAEDRSEAPVDSNKALV